jgi:hypothetical protein
MSYPHSKSFFCSDNFVAPADSLAALDGAPTFVRSSDQAVDAALRDVPLPEGMMRRLSQLASTMSDEVSDSVDYLGC